MGEVGTARRFAAGERVEPPEGVRTGLVGGLEAVGRLALRGPRVKAQAGEEARHRFSL